MYELLKRVIKKMPSPENNELVNLNIIALFAQAYKTGYIASRNQQYELARNLACFIFDTLDYVRINFAHILIETIVMEKPEDCSTELFSIPYPQHLGQLEFYVEEYLIGSRNDISESDRHKLSNHIFA